MRADAVIIGAGIAGLSTAYHLACRRDITNIAVVDPRPPLTLTSDKSTECYRNFWPNDPMIALMNRSIDIYEELAEVVDFGLNQRGYVFVTADTERFQSMQDDAARMAERGVRASVLDPDQLRISHPYITSEAIGAVHWERAGWFRGQDLGQWMLEQARAAGTNLIRDEVVDMEPGRVLLQGGDEISTSAIIVAAGPMSRAVGSMAGLDLPLYSELHLKVSFRDHLGVIPRDSTMTIWSDPQTLGWDDDERSELEAMGRNELLGEMPVFCHFRPEGGSDSPYIVALWEYHHMILEPTWPLPEDPLYPEVVMRGLTTMVPGLGVYLNRMPASTVDGGYYTRTAENRPLVGPSGVDGVFLMCGFSGFGIMAAAGAADLLAAHVTGEEPPSYSDSFLLNRYDNPEYVASIQSDDDGQL